PRPPTWLYWAGRSAMRQMLAASSSTATIGGGRPPPPPPGRAGPAPPPPPGPPAPPAGAGGPGPRRPGRGGGAAPAGTRAERGHELILRRGDPGQDLLVVQAGRRGAGGLVDAVAGLRGAMLHAAQAGRQAGQAGAPQQVGGNGGGGVGEPPVDVA